MSCAFVLALPQIAIINTDTRLNFNLKNGELKVNDGEILNLTWEDGTVETIKREGRKSKSFPGGWAAGVGQFDLVSVCLTELSKHNARTPVTINAQLQKVYNENIDRIKQRFPDDPQIDKTSIIYFYQTKERFKMSGISFSKDIIIPEEGDFFLASPPELLLEDLEIARAILRGMSSPIDMPSIASLIKIISESFYYVHTKTLTVSNISDMNIFIRAEGNNVIRRHIFLENTAIMNMNQGDVLQLIQ